MTRIVAAANGILIVNGLKEDPDGDDDMYLWDISEVPDGTYHVYATINDNTSSVTSYAQATVKIDTIPPTVTAAPLGGTYAQAPDVILSASEPSVIYYTTDGNNPTTNSLFYTSPIEIAANTTIRFMAIDAAGNQSQIAVATYTIEVSPNIPPEAHAGADFTIQLGETASPDGSASLDSDNGPGTLTFRWSFETLPTGSVLTDADVSGADTASPYFIPDVAGTYVLELEVGDGIAFNYDNVSVIVEAGTEGPVDITAKTTLIKSGLLYDRRAMVSYLNVTLTNISQNVLTASVRVVIDSISTSSVKVANADGLTSDGKPYFEYVSGSATLLPGQSTTAKTWKFSNPTQARFTYVVSVWSVVP